MPGMFEGACCSFSGSRRDCAQRDPLLDDLQEGRLPIGTVTAHDCARGKRRFALLNRIRRVACPEEFAGI